MFFYPSYPATLVPTLYSSRSHSPTHVSSISVPASTHTAPVQPPTQESPVSVPASRLPTMPLYPLLVPTVWISFTIASVSLLLTKFLPRSPKVVYMPPPGTNMPLSCDRPPRSSSHWHIIQISAVKLSTAPRLSIISLCRSYLTVFLPLPTLLPPQASHMYHQLEVVLVYP